MSTSRPLMPVCWLLAGTMLVGATAPLAVWAQPVRQSAPFAAPETRDLTRIQKRFASGRPARIIGEGRTQVVNAPRITPDGVAWLAPSDARQDTLPPSTMVHWTDIERLQTRGSAAGVGAASGAIVVGLMTLVIGLSLASDPFLGGNNAGVMAATAGGALFGAGIGALVGAAIPKWVNVHIGRSAR